jgi:hypothetical protein
VLHDKMSEHRGDAGHSRIAVDVSGARTFRLAELLAALSLAADLGNDFPPEHSLRTCLLALALGREVGLSTADLNDVYYAALLRFVGCVATSHELGARFGDDNRVRGAMTSIDRGHAGDRLRALGKMREGRGVVYGARIAATMLVSGEHLYQEAAAADCEVAGYAASRMGVASTASPAIRHAFVLSRRLDCWHRHNVEEVGNLPHFLPELYAAYGP